MADPGFEIFPDGGGGATLEFGAKTFYLARFFCQNYMKEIGPGGAAPPPPPWISQCLDNLTDKDYLVKECVKLASVSISVSV